MKFKDGLRALVARQRATLVVENTGPAIETGCGTAVTGYNGPPPRPGQKIIVKNTGSATATGDGDAVSGISYT